MVIGCYTQSMNNRRTKVGSVKTAVSLRRDLAEEADALARELGVTRSRLYAVALGEFLRRHENRRLLERLNEVYGEALDPEEAELLARTKEYHRRRVFDGGG